VTATDMTIQFSGAASLRGRMVYFAHPIDIADLDPRQTAQMYSILRELQQAGAIVYDPAGAFSIGAGVKPNPAVAQVNRGAILSADAMIACYPESPGVGVSMEIQMADALGMPTVVLSSIADRSWSLAGLEHALTISDVASADWPSWLAEEAAEYAAIKGREPRVEPMPMWVQTQDPKYTPIRKHHDDAAFDLFVSEETKVEAGEIRDIPAGCAVQLPEGTWALILGRSSTSRTHKLLVHPGVIDTGYRGPLFVQVENIGEADFLAEPGVRLGQLIPLPNLAGQMAAIGTVMLAPSDRGPQGFGSTGK
jgi:dUTP pyrophosphatase